MIVKKDYLLRDILILTKLKNRKAENQIMVLSSY